MAAILVVGVVAFRAGAPARQIAIMMLVLAAVEFSIGVAAVLTSLPIGLAVAHNWFAALLLLTLLKLLSLGRTAAVDAA
jgi:cytochrome c oxidase assembly protein subunit 15